MSEEARDYTSELEEQLRAAGSLIESLEDEVGARERALEQQRSRQWETEGELEWLRGRLG